MKLVVLAVVILTILPASAEPRQCKNSSTIVGACFMVHGEVSWGFGNPSLRIWPIGTKRILGVTAGPSADESEDPIAPKEMWKFDPSVEALFGDFEVCPFTLERKGHMQMVCVESAKKLVVKRRPPNQR